MSEEVELEGASERERLFFAAKTGRLKEFQELLRSSKVRLNVADGLGNTPLHYAAAGDHGALAIFMLKTDKKIINLPNSVGDTPLHKVIYFSTL